MKRDTVSTFSAGHRTDFSDLDGDESIDILYLDHGMLRTYDSRGTAIYSYAFETEQLSGPVIFSIGHVREKNGGLR
ncbi:MAG: hypothetical protein U5L72_04055 [Bacteroidales bacterium]|nr:hypothetical protein [Bacteroidales bacterium]